MKVRDFLLLAAATLPLVITLPAQAQYQIRDPYSEALVQQAQRDLWNSYTPRQRNLATIISQISYAYFQRTGQPLPVNSETISIVMEGIGARQSEAGFVRDRMRANSNGAQGIISLERATDRTERFIQCLQAQGTGCSY